MIAELIFIFIFTLILVGLLVSVGRYRTFHTQAYRYHVAYSKDEDPPPDVVGVGLTMLFFFFLLFPLILAGSFWIGPYGPVFMEISWMPIVVIGILLALMVGALSPRDPDPVARDADAPEEPIATGVFALFGVAFFLLLFAAIGLILAAFV